MSKVTLQQAQRIATFLSGAVKGMNFYPPAHPSVVQPLRELFTQLTEILRDQSEVSMGITEGIFFLEKHLFPLPPAAVAEIAGLMEEKEVDGIVVRRGLLQEELAALVAVLAARGLKGAEAKKALADRKVTAVMIVVDNVETDFDPKGAYGEALNAVKGVWKEIENGRIPNSREVIAVVDHLVDVAIQDASTLLGLSMIKDYDNYTFNHSVNVGVLALALASALNLDRQTLKDAGVAGLLHDLGKTKIDKSILNKPGRLTPEEFELMKQHPETGMKIIEEMDGISSSVALGVVGHHVRYNRTGYPEWVREEKLPLLADIIAVADSYDAITTLRSYQRPMTPRSAIDTLRKLSGRELDTDLVEKFIDLMGDYPVGSLVRLDTNELAVVFRPNAADTTAPTVKTIMSADGELYEEPRIEKVGSGGGAGPMIIGEVDPFTRKIDVAVYLS